MNRRSVSTVLLAASLSSGAAQAQPATGDISRFTVRRGYTVTRAVEDLHHARFLEFDDKGTLFVSRPRECEIVALRDGDGDGVYEVRSTFITGKPTAHGMDFDGGWLYFTTRDAVFRARDADGDGEADDIETVISPDQLVAGRTHWWRSILVTDDHIYTSVGDTGNINEAEDTEYQKIYRFNRDGSGKALFATGIRNTEKLRLRPGTDEVWGVDHGSDWFGRELGEQRAQGFQMGKQPVTDHNPPDEFNHYVEGAFYGHPYITGHIIPRYEYADRDDIIDLAARTVPPEWNFGAHWAANGFTFVEPDLNRGSRALPADHVGDAFVACHGSWNSAVRVGYNVVRVLFDDGDPYGELTIVSTIEPDGSRIHARPVDCAQAPDGSILFSCDVTSSVYRITWTGEGAAGAAPGGDSARD